MIIICHRGISNLYLENSLTAFRRLSNYSGTWVEFDIHATVDDVLIVYHDFDLSRLTTTKDPRLIREMLYSEIQKLTLINGEKIPTLAEVMKVIPSSHTINIELKGEGTGFLVDSIVQQKREDESYLKQTIIFSSFLKNELDAAKALIPEGNFSVLVREDSSDWKERVATIDPVSVNFDVDHITEENVTYVHGLNKKVFVFTVNTQEQFDRMAKLGVDGVFTDFSEISTLGQ